LHSFSSSCNHKLFEIFEASLERWLWNSAQRDARVVGGLVDVPHRSVKDLSTLNPSGIAFALSHEPLCLPDAFAAG
jgi:hypothetical protein